MTTIHLTLINRSKTKLVVMIEPEGRDFSLMPDQEFDLRAEAIRPDGNFVVEHADGYIAVYPDRDVDSISVFHNGIEVACGYQRDAEVRK